MQRVRGGQNNRGPRPGGHGSDGLHAVLRQGRGATPEALLVYDILMYFSPSRQTEV